MPRFRIHVITMESNHVGDEVRKKQQLQSIFSVFSNLFSEKGGSGKHILSLINLISGGNFTVGSGSDLQYSIKRFIRGLASAHLYSQCASFAALSSLLKYEIISTEQVLDVLHAESKGNFTRSEEGALNIGCVLTCGAIIQSGTYSTLSTETKQTILNKLISSGKTKSYLSAVAHKFLVDIAQAVSEEDFKNVIWPMCKKEIKPALSESNISDYDFLLVCRSRYPEDVNKFIIELESSFELFIQKVVSLLINGHTKSDDSVYDRVCQVLVGNKKLLIQVWEDCVNNVNQGSSRDKRVILLFYHILKNLKDKSVIPRLLVPRFIEILIIILSFSKTKKSEENNWHALAKTSLDFLVNSLINEEVTNAIRFKTIQKLMFYPANMKFEKKTGTKCIQSLILHLNEKTLKQLAAIHKNIISGELKKIVDEEGTNEDWNNNEKQYALHIFVKFVNHSSVKSDKEWKLEQIKFLFDTGFIKNFKFHSSVQKCARDCFYKAIGLQMPNLEDVIELLDELVHHVDIKIKKGEVELSENVNQSWNKAFSTVNKLKKSEEKLFIVVHLLLVHMGLQLFSDSELAQFNIEELLACYARLKTMHKRKNNSVTNEDLHWTEVTVDLMLSLLSRDNKLWRYVVCNLVFPQMVKHITPSALHQIIDVLNPQSTNKVFSDERSDGSDDSEENDGDADEEGDEKSESSLSESDNEKITLNDQFRSAIKDALGISAALTDQESINMDDMDEEEGRKLNERLAEAFKMYKPNSGKQSKKQSKEEKALMHFRFRVLDLVEIYVVNSPTLAGCLDLLFPLFNLLELAIKDPNQRTLQHRVESVLKKVSSLKKFPDVENVTQSLILDHFDVLLNRKDLPSMIFVEMAPRISECCAFLVRCSQSIPHNESDIPLASNYIALLDNFFHSRENKLPSTLFQSVMRSMWLGNWKLASSLFDLLVDPTIKLFKKMKMIELLEIFYKNSRLHSLADAIVKNELTHVENRFVKKFVSYLSEHESKKTNEKMFLAFFTKILSLIMMAHQSLKKHRADTKKLPQWKVLVSKMTEIDAVVTNKKSRKHLAKLANVFDVKMPELATERRRSTASGSSLPPEQTTDNDEDETKETSKNKNKIQKTTAEKMRMKKESIKLREAAGNDGIEIVPFSSLDVYSIPQNESEAEEDAPEPKTKKRKYEAGMNGDISMEEEG